MKIRNQSRTALRKVRKYFPQVNKVIDATESITVSVESGDSDSGRQKDPAKCALARACVRNGADGAIINVGFSYVVKGEVATRYATSVGVGREITSYDRHKDFATGKDYVLSKVAPSCRLGANKRSGPSGKDNPFKKDKSIAIHKHKTSRIRVSPLTK